MQGVCHGFYCNGLKASPFQFWENPLDGSQVQVFQSDFPKADAKSDQNEHSLELEMPYLCLLMKLAKNLKPILPIYCGSDPSAQEIEKLKKIVQD